MSMLRAVAWGWVKAEDGDEDAANTHRDVSLELRPTALRIYWRPSTGGYAGAGMYGPAGWILRQVGGFTDILAQGTYQGCCIKAVEILDGVNKEEQNLETPNHTTI